MNKKHTSFRQRQQGSYLVIFGGLVLVLTGFAVLAVDIGRIFIVRSELQNVADAAALAGANCLTRENVKDINDCPSTMATALNWRLATKKAEDQLSQNQAKNQPISCTGCVETGYWDILNKRPSGGTLTSPLLSNFGPIGTYDKPAVRVQLDTNKIPSVAISMLTEGMFGRTKLVNMKVTAVAVISSPSGVAAGQITPIAIDKCILDKYWDSAKASPKLATSNTLKIEGVNNKYADVPQTKGTPWVIRIFQSNSNSNSNKSKGKDEDEGADKDVCETLRWTAFLKTNPKQKEIELLFASKNPTALQIDDSIYLENGNMSDLFKEFSLGIITVPVMTDLGNGRQEIYAFASFQITVNGGVEKKYIEGSFVGINTSSGSSGIGPFYGTYTPPRLAY
ncbi:MAG: pilus assembly protein TadG-related protein [Polaromonas sp.]|nr:pilus assembly protein TadG-related protein [Polaromonas sp.]